MGESSKFPKSTFCGFSMGSNQYLAGRVYALCVNFMKGTPEGSTESGFMEKSGIKPATTALQDKGFLTIAECPLNMCIHNFKFKWSKVLRQTKNKSEKLL